jgi:predicted DNA-binding protein
MLNVQLDQEIERRLEALGARDAVAKVTLAREALLRALEEEMEAEGEWARLVDERKASAAGEKVWSLEALERGDDLAG